MQQNDIHFTLIVNIINKFTTKGLYKECRMNNGYLYVVSEDNYSKNQVKPMVNDEPIDCDDIYICKCTSYSSYVVFTSYDMKAEPKLIDSKAVLNNGNIEMYVSGSNIYLISNTWEYDNNKVTDKMEISKFSYADGIITPLKQAEIEGWLQDVFCIDEYNDYLRIVVTRNTNFTRINTLYVLNKELDITGKIDDIAPDESIYSARFTGDIGYFVTFEQIDPLFSVDLSDPTNPKIIGELKIPGFSEYMHIWDENTMFGIGKEEGFLKLSMFDITDPANVTENDKTILYDMYYSSALYNHKAIFVSGEKNVIGFFGEGNTWSYDVDLEYEMGIYKYIGLYYLYSYEDGKFVQKAEIPINMAYYIEVRGMYIGDYIYIVTTTGDITVISMKNYEVEKTITNDVYSE